MALGMHPTVSQQGTVVLFDTFSPATKQCAADSRLSNMAVKTASFLTRTLISMSIPWI
jgi:hypothetical protein